MGVKKETKSLIRGMIGAEVDFIVLGYDNIANVAIASRKLAMEIRAKIELPKLKVNDIIRVRTVAVSRKYVIVDCYGKEVIIMAEDLKHTFIVNAKEEYVVGDMLQVRVKKIEIENEVIELSAKELTVNPYKNIRKYIVEGGEYISRVIGYPKQKSGVIVQLEISNVTCLVRVPAKFNNNPHFGDKLLIKITDIQEKKKLLYGVLKRILS